MEGKKTFYDQVPFKCDERTRIWYNRLNKLLDRDFFKNKTILDIGCGPGTISDIIQKKGGEVYSLDISSEEIELAKKLNPKLKTIVASTLKIPFPDGRFDISFSMGVLHHTPNCRKGFRETSRVTKKGGDVIIGLYTKYHPYQLIYEVSRIFTKGKDPTRIPKILILSFKYLFRIFGKKLSDKEINNLLADAIYTPIATFHSKKQVKKWGEEEGLKLVRTKLICLGLLRWYHFKKIR